MSIMSFPPSFMLNADFHAHRLAFWYVLMDLATDVDSDDADGTDAAEAYAEIYSDY
jgi:hypothetical protein